MYDSPFLIAGVVAFIYLVFRLAEMRFILKEKKSPKIFLRESLLVFVSVLLGNYLLARLKPLTKMTENTDVFVTAPDF